MTKTKSAFEIHIEGDIPDGNDDLGAEATVATKGPVAAIVEQLTGMGIKNITATRRPVRRNAAKQPAPIPAQTGTLPAHGHPRAAE